MSKLVKDAACQALPTQNVVATSANKLIGYDELEERTVRFVARTVEIKTGGVENVYKTEGIMAEVVPSAPAQSSQVFQSQYSRSTRRSQQSQRMKRRKYSVLQSGLKCGSPYENPIVTKTVGEVNEDDFVKSSRTWLS